MLEGAALADWLSQRVGKLTASRMKHAIAFLKNGQPAKERTDYLKELLAERLTQSTIRRYVTDAMQWGIECEASALQAYEAHSGEFIAPCGVYDHPRIDMFAATPDGLLGADGLIETKCPTTATFVDWVMAGVVPDEHKPQMLAQLACTGRRFVEFVAYDPRVKKMSPLFIRRFEPSAEEIADIEAKAEAFLADVERAWEILTTRAA